jgi:penicillin-binding protein 1A
MLDSIKQFWKNKITQPLGRLFAPITDRLAAWFEPVGRVFKPYKERFDERWAAFSFSYPRLSVWVRRGTKVAAALYVFNLVFAIGLFGEMPSIEELQAMQTPNTSQVYSADSVMVGKFYRENRKDIEYSHLPQHVVDALVYTEDKRYWTHTGVDVRALGRVLWFSLIRGDEKSGGGSTLSQQLAKNLFGRKKYAMLSTPINKVREMLMARRLEKAFDKKNLLSFYLNTVPFGGNVFGIEMASQRFFNKPTDSLSVTEGAVIIGMLQLNTKYNPRRNPEASQKRRNEVLDNLIEEKKLDKKIGEKLKTEPIKLNYQPVLNRDNMASYFKDYIRTQMPKLLENIKKEDGKPYNIYEDGLKIYTSIDSKMQLMAESAVHERMSKLQSQFDSHWSGQKWWADDKWLEDAMRNSDRWKKMAIDGMNEKKIRNFFMTQKLPITLFAWDNGKPAEDERSITLLDSIKYYYRQLNSSFVAMDPKTGLIKAWVGGTDFNFFQYDHVRSRRQVGSTFKPIVYAKALQAGIKPCDYIPNSLTAYMSDGTTKSGWQVSEKEKEEGKAWVPHNSEDDYGGSYSLEGALTSSANVISAQLIYRVGFREVQGLAKKMGVTSEMQNDMSIALGTADISLFDMIKVYGTFATRGKRPDPIVVLKVADRDGRVLADFTKDINPSKWEQVLTVDQADMMTQMMQSVVEEGTGERMRSTYDIKGDLAGKTGTTQSQADGWFMGYTPNLVFGAWVGGIMPIIRFRDMNLGQGAHMALPICGIFMKKMQALPQYAATKTAKFPEPSKWIKDSMNCDHKEYSEEEVARFQEENLMDSLSQMVPYDPTLPQQKIEDNKKEEDHDLRARTDDFDGDIPKARPDATVQPATKPLNPPVKPQNPQSTPQNKTQPATTGGQQKQTTPPRNNR